ncbi:hypothetical protein HPSJM_02700 [Helicobacter pylori SJM180]|uniref:hypothetical protein n=1 Tax=Helicobacter pylori TaxID=210 RepID=UPI0001E5817B|nr:hypothetical protein [Helicobacter pylori]ADO02136.1 hypothetical protein HPSJM_02700 [Helicobacter pylori SJM180]
MAKSYYNEDVGGYYSKQTGKRLHGAALYNAEAKHLNGGLKQTLDQNEQLKVQIEQRDQALYYSLSLINKQDKEIQHLKNTLGSFLSALNFDIPSLDSNKS